MNTNYIKHTKSIYSHEATKNTRQNKNTILLLIPSFQLFSFYVQLIDSPLRPLHPLRPTLFRINFHHYAS